MFTYIKRFWRDRQGAISPAAMILVLTITVVGGIVGLVSFRDQVVQELGDLAVGLENLNQSYDVEVDANDDCDLNDPGDIDIDFNDITPNDANLIDEDCDPPACLTLGVAPSNEGA